MRLFEFAEANSVEATSILMNEAEIRMAALANHYYFTPGAEMMLPGLDLALQFTPDELNHVRMVGNPGAELVQLFDEQNILLEVPLEAVLVQRKSNLVSETKVKIGEQGAHHIPYIVAECGFGTDVDQIMLQALDKGLVKCWGQERLVE